LVPTVPNWPVGSLPMLAWIFPFPPTVASAPSRNAMLLLISTLPLTLATATTVEPPPAPVVPSIWMLPPKVPPSMSTVVAPLLCTLPVTVVDDPNAILRLPPGTTSTLPFTVVSERSQPGPALTFPLIVTGPMGPVHEMPAAEAPVAPNASAATTSAVTAAGSALLIALSRPPASVSGPPPRSLQDLPL